MGILWVRTQDQDEDGANKLDEDAVQSPLPWMLAMHFAGPILVRDCCVLIGSVEFCTRVPSLPSKHPSQNHPTSALPMTSSFVGWSADWLRRLHWPHQLDRPHRLQPFLSRS